MSSEKKWTSLQSILAMEEDKALASSRTEIASHKLAQPKQASLEGSETHLEPTPEPTPTNSDQLQPNSIAPVRDFNRRANSLERDALPAGMFPGASKKLYDALYLRTKGAVQPRSSVQATKRDLMEWSGIRNVKTIEVHIRHLLTIGLISREGDVGDRAGYSYRTVLPEELYGGSDAPTPTNPNHDGGGWGGTNPNQKTGMGWDQKSVLVGVGKTLENKGTYKSPNTSFKTHTDDDDTHILTDFNKVLLETVRDVVGGELNDSEQERQRWKEVGQILAEELKSAAQNTGGVSSTPAFLAAHLRRRLVKRGQTRPTPDKPLKSEPQQGAIEENKKTLQRAGHGEMKSRFTIEECRRYAEHLHTSGQGITNPGGYATTIHRTGEADELIGRFFNPPAPTTSVDASQCPDCRGTGWWYPKGPEMGVARCKHERLASNVEGSAN